MHVAFWICTTNIILFEPFLKFAKHELLSGYLRKNALVRHNNVISILELQIM